MIPDKYTNSSVSRLLKEVAAAYEVLEEDKFRIRAYQNASTSIEHATSEVYDLWEQGRLREISGIGASLAAHLDEFFKTGKAKHFEETFAKLPDGMFGVFGLQGIGAKTAFKLAVALKIKNRDTAEEKVKKAALEGKIRVLDGFGEKKEAEILEVIEKLKPGKEKRGRMLLPVAEEIANRYLHFLQDSKLIEQIEPLGSIRRRVATVGDLDFAVATTNPKAVLEKFVTFAEIAEVLNIGEVKASVLLKNGVRVDLMAIEPDSFGSMLQHFTGSKLHNVALRTYALEKGLSLSEHGIKKEGKLKKFADEKSFYEYIGLPLIPPELREDRGELQAAEKKLLPDMITLEDIKGDIHTHTDFSDGSNTLEEMVDGALKLGYEYFGVSDHAPSVINRGETSVMSIITSTRNNIEQINSSNTNLRLLFGYEVNILSNAEISLPDKFLKLLDYAIGSIHTSFDQPKDKITKRLISAIKNPYITFIAHPTGRLINERDSYECDWELLFKEALEYGKFIEINAHPERLDLPDLLVREALEKGVKLIINTDAHHIDHLKLMRYGIDVARRGWATKKDVINTLPRDKFLKTFLKR
ncbi:MAG: DNA polymerase/3'-5' exonuclease PolX [Patescibacteria group bacterium]